MGVREEALDQHAVPPAFISILGRALLDAHGHTLGAVDQVFIDSAGMPVWVALKAPSGRESLVPLLAASRLHDALRVPYTRRELDDAPEVDFHRQRLDEEVVADLQRYWERISATARLHPPLRRSSVGAGTRQDDAEENDTPRDSAVVKRAEVAERGEVVEVHGRSAREVQVALRLLDAAHSEQRAHVDAFASSLLTAMVSAGVDVAPQPSLAQAKRSAALRAQLMQEGVHTYATLTELRGASRESSTRTWVTRRRDEHALIVVKHEGRSLIPAFQLDQHGEPRAELRPLIAALAAAGSTGWQAWTWLRSASSLLSGQVPEQLARTEPERALRAARRHSAQRAA